MGVGSFFIPQIGTQEVEAEEWQRPLDWLPIDHLVSATDQKIVILAAVFPNAKNWFNILLTSTGGWTATISDGTTVTGGSGGAINRSLNYADFPDNTLTKGGYKQALITITPNAGVNLTTVRFTERATGITGIYSTTFLDMIISLPNASGSVNSPIIFYNTSAQQHYLLERVKVMSIGTSTTLESAFRGVRSIVCLDMNNCVGNVTNFGNLISQGFTNNGVNLLQAGQLKFLKNFNANSATNFTSAFVGTNLIETPIITSNAITGTAEMFNISSNIRKINAINCNGGTIGISNLYSLEWCDAYNIGASINFSASKLLSREAIVNIFNNLNTVATTQNINITGCLGASSLTTAERAIATGKNWTITG